MANKTTAVLGRVALLVLAVSGCGGTEPASLLATSGMTPTGAGESEPVEASRLTARMSVGSPAAVLSDGHRRATINLSEHVGPSLSHACSVRYDRIGSDGRWVILDVRGQSRHDAAAGFAGAGVEGSLIWIELDAAFRAVRVQAFVYESMVHTVDPVGGVQQTPGGIAVRADCLDRMTTVRASFDAGRPDRGFTLRAEPMN